MSEARKRLETALARLEAAAAARPKPDGPATVALQARCASLEAATRDAVARIDRLLAADNG